MQETNAGRVAPPPLYLALTDIPRAFLDLGALPLAAPWLGSAPRGDGHPVLVLPGFSTSDRSTGILRGYLEGLGYDVHAWELGRNLGPRSIGADGEILVARLEQVFNETGQKVSLVGWSLGGMMARLVARRRPDMVRQVISLGSPIAGDPRSTSVWRLYQMLTGHKVSEPEVAEQMRESEEVPPVPATAIFSKSDGIVPWQNCLEPDDLKTDNIQVYGSHCGLGMNPSVLYAVADRLALKDGEWSPFKRSGLRAMVYPSSGHVH
jgi:pimeloyl-ACP methyl ester carboxylesterase